MSIENWHILKIIYVFVIISDTLENRSLLLTKLGQHKHKINNISIPGCRSFSIALLSRKVLLPLIRFHKNSNTFLIIQDASSTTAVDSTPSQWAGDSAANNEGILSAASHVRRLPTRPALNESLPAVTSDLSVTPAPAVYPQIKAHSHLHAGTMLAIRSPTIGRNAFDDVVVWSSSLVLSWLGLGWREN